MPFIELKERNGKEILVNVDNILTIRQVPDKSRDKDDCIVELVGTGAAGTEKLHVYVEGPIGELFRRLPQCG